MPIAQVHDDGTSFLALFQSLTTRLDDDSFGRCDGGDPRQGQAEEFHHQPNAPGLKCLTDEKEKGRRT